MKGTIEIYMMHIPRNEIESVKDDIGNCSITPATRNIKVIITVSNIPNIEERKLEIYDITTTIKDKSMASGTNGRTKIFAMSAYTDTVPNVYIIYGSVAT